MSRGVCAWYTHECVVHGYGCAVCGACGLSVCMHSRVPLCPGAVYEHVCEDCGCLFRVLSQE